MQAGSRARKRSVCFVWVCLGVFVLGFGSEVLAEPITLQLKYPEGRKTRYKNKYSLEYFSNRAELIIMSTTGGTMRVNIDGEWRSHEEVIQPVTLPNEEVPEGTMSVRAKVDKGASRAIFLGERQTYEQYPFTLDLFNDRSFIWRITPEGGVTKFEPEFPAYKVDRLDLVTDIFQYWVPCLRPVLPDKPVAEGDTWTGEHRYERPFASMDMLGRSALVAFKSTYQVKEIKKKKNSVEVKIEETREVEYHGWLDVSSASLFYSGTGTGGGEWVIDNTLGLVLEHKVHMDIDRPTIAKAGRKDPLSDIHAEVKIDLERKLEKVE